MQPHVSRRERAGSSLPRSFGRGCCRRRRKQCRVGARRTRAHAGLMEMTYRRCEADGYLDGRRFAASREYVGSTVVLVELLLLLFTRACLSLPGAEIVVLLVVSERMSNRIFTSGSRHHERASTDDEQPEYCIKPCSTMRANSQPEGHQARPTSTNMTSASREPTPKLIVDGGWRTNLI